MTVVFVFVKDSVVKILGENDDVQFHQALLNDGWKHTATIDVCCWIEYICNCSADINKDVMGLKKIEI